MRASLLPALCLLFACEGDRFDDAEIIAPCVWEQTEDHAAYCVNQ